MGTIDTFVVVTLEPVVGHSRFAEESDHYICVGVYAEPLTIDGDEADFSTVLAEGLRIKGNGGK